MDLETLMWKMYRRGVVHGGVVAVLTAAIYLIM